MILLKIAAVIAALFVLICLIWGLCWLAQLADSTDHMIETPEDWE